MVGLVAGLVVGVLGATVGRHAVHLAFSAVTGTSAGEDPGPADHAPAPETYATDRAEQVTAEAVNGTGLARAKDGYRLDAVTAPTKAGTAGKLRFTVTGPDGSPAREFAPVMTKPMQVYVVRADLADFHHLRPTMGADGTWSAPISWKRPGPHRVMAEFSALDARGGIHHLVLGTTVKVAGKYVPEALPAPASSATVDGYKIKLTGQAPDAYSSGNLRLHITRQDEDVASLQPYLGSFVVVTCFNAADNAVMRTVPVEVPEGPSALGGPKFTLTPVFPKSGDYRMFFEFRTFDQIRTATLTLRAP